MKFWSFTGMVLIGISIGLLTEFILPGILLGIGLGILSVVGISILTKYKLQK